MIKQYIQDQKAWLEQNFPDSPPAHSLLGVSEELGELVVALNDYHAGGNLTQVTAQVTEEIGDVLIYLTDYCNRSGLDFAVILDNHPINTPAATQYQNVLEFVVPLVLQKLMKYNGLLARAQLKTEQKIRAQDVSGLRESAAANIVKELRFLAALLGLDVETAMLDTFYQKTQKRDWRNNQAANTK